MTEPRIVTKKMIEQVFDDAATSYNRTGPNIFTQFGMRLVERMPLKGGMRVLDVATGTGAVLLPAAQRVGTEGRVIGIDLSRAILEEAEYAVRAGGLANVELRRMDAEHLEFPNQDFDVITCAFGLFLIPDLDAALREIHRVCKPGGFLGVSLFAKTPPPFAPGLPILLQQFMAYQVGVRAPQPLAYAPEEVEAMLVRAGFRTVEAQSETNDIVYADAEDWWAFLLTLVPRLSILSMTAETRAQFKDEHLAKLRPLLHQDGLHLSLGVIYAQAQR
jgi:O-methyltransferase / aklanonic acid methyltransferase